MTGTRLDVFWRRMLHKDHRRLTADRTDCKIRLLHEVSIYPQLLSFLVSLVKLQEGHMYPNQLKCSLAGGCHPAAIYALLGTSKGPRSRQALLLRDYICHLRRHRPRSSRRLQFRRSPLFRRSRKDSEGRNALGQQFLHLALSRDPDYGFMYLSPLRTVGKVWVQTRRKLHQLIRRDATVPLPT